MNSRDIIVICLAIFLFLSIVPIMTLSPDSTETNIFDIIGSKESSMLDMTSNPHLNEGDSLSFKLYDENGTAMPNQEIALNLTDENRITENFTFETNSNGECSLEDLIPGQFSFIAKYYGNDNYTPSDISGTITVNNLTDDYNPSDINGTITVNNLTDDE